MRVLIIDGQGGRIGRQLIEVITKKHSDLHITAIGTNSIATSAMLKGGAHDAATGENAVIVACRKADVIIGPLGIVIADSLLGEVSPAMALAVSQADSVRILIPMNRCENLIAGIDSQPLSSLIEDAVCKLERIMSETH